LRTREGMPSIVGHGVLAVSANQFGERGEQAGLREAVAIDAIMARFRPGLVEIAERRLLLVGVRQRSTGRTKRHRQALVVEISARCGPPKPPRIRLCLA